MARFGLVAAEVSLLRDIVELAATASAGPDAMRQLMGDLQQLVGCESVSCFSLDVPARRMGYHQHVASGEHDLAPPELLEEVAAEADDDPFFALYWGSPCARPEWAQGPVAQAISQFSTPQQWRDDPMREALELEAGPIVDEILLSYPHGHGRSRRILLTRGHGPRFGERELSLVTLLLPHLDRPLAAATLPASPASSLTDRQWEILELVRIGLANKQIAHALGISAGTVRKHLENIYTRLGVQSRTEAAAVAADTDAAREQSGPRHARGNV